MPEYPLTNVDHESIVSWLLIMKCNTQPLAFSALLIQFSYLFDTFVDSIPLGEPLLETTLEVRNEDGQTITDGEGQLFIGECSLPYCSIPVA